MSAFTSEQWVDWIDLLADRDYVVIDNFLPDEDYGRIRLLLMTRLEEDKFQQAGIGSVYHNHKETTVRSDYTHWIDKKRDQELNSFFEVVDETISNLNRFCFLSLSGFEFHFAHYPEGTFYKRHLDQFKERSNRLISMIIYLNEDWQQGDGGELVIYKDDETIRVDPLANRCILFKSTVLEHEVLTSYKDRYSLTGWLLYQPSGVGYILG